MLDNLRRKFTHSNIKTFYSIRSDLRAFEGVLQYRDTISHISTERCLKKASKTSFKCFCSYSTNISLNGIHMKMIPCPIVQRRITTFFLLGETEITQELYQAVMGKNPSDCQNKPKNPVERVSWGDAILFCNELSKLQGLEECYTKNSAEEYDWVCDPDKNGYRLPTEKEWENAARAGTKNGWSGTDKKEELGRYAVYDGSRTSPVKSKAPNEWGFYDMSGNVQEWCWDRFSPHGYSSDPRVVRGGCFAGDGSSLRSATRGKEQPRGNQYTGFRVCRSIVI